MTHSLSIARGAWFAVWAASAATAAITDGADALPETPTAPFTYGTAFAPYQIIIDREIFGRPPPVRQNPTPAAAATPDPTQMQAEALAKKITLCAVNRTPSGNTAVGFIDNDAKPPRNIYLNVGDDADGYRIIAADYDAETATIEKDGVTITLKLGKGLIGAGAASGAPAVATADRGRSMRWSSRSAAGGTTSASTLPAGVIRRPAMTGMPPDPITAARQREERAQRMMDFRTLREEGGDVHSYMTKLHERRAQEREEQAAAEDAARQKIQELARQMTEEELRKQEREINLSLIEGGARPISEIELTPEEEANLVEKGVL